MHLKFLARGTGSAAVAVAYLLALKDAAGKVRAAVEVLRGDPMLVAAIADGLPFMHRYTSGVGAWSPEDAPTRPELERFVDEFEKTAWAGLDRDRYVWAAVLHRDEDGGVHLHFIAARCDLATGLSLNIAPPGWETTFDPLRDAFNYEHGWSRPDDPSRARPFRPAPHRAYQARAARRAGEDVEPDPRREIGMHLLELVDAGKVKDRAGVVAALEARGYDVPRQGEHYVTARDPATGERWRLKGALYERDFDRERFLRDAPEPTADRDRADDVDAPAAAAWKAVEKARRRRADYNRAYYGPCRLPGWDGVQAGGGEVERESGPAAGRSVGHDASLAAHLERELGDGAVSAVAAAAEPVRDRRADAGGGRGERSLAAGDALAEAARAAGPELSRLLGEHEHVADRERAVCATSMGEQWLAEAQQEVLVEEEDRPLTVGEKARAVKTVEGRLETDLSRRESAVAATSSGPALLQEAFGKRSYGDAPLSFSARERGLERVEQRVDEELRTQEEALRAIPPGKRYLSSAEQARAAGAAGPPTLADRESMVHAATQQVGEELDRREEELLAIITGDALLVETVDALFGDDRTRSLGERWEACEGAASGVEKELDRREAAIQAGPAGEEFLRDARLEVLGAAEREAATLGERARIVKAAVEAKRQAETWNEEKAARVEKLRALPGGLDLYHAHVADRDPKWRLRENTPPAREHDEAALAAAESDDTRLKRLRDVLSDEADATCYQEVLDQVVGQFKTSDLDNALAAGEKARAERETQQWEEKRDALVDELHALPGGMDLYHAHLADRDPKWDRKRNRKSSREHIDAALGAAKSDAPRLERLRGVLSDAADVACYQGVLDQVVGQFKMSDLDNALAAGEKARAERETQQWEEKRDALVDELRALPGGMDLYHAHLADRDPDWDRNRNDRTRREHIDAALGAAKSDAPRLERLHGLLSDEADATCYQEVLDQVVGQFKTSDLDNALAAGEREREEREALETVTAAAQVAAARSNVELPGAHPRAIYETGETHAAGLAAVSRTTEALNAAADQRLPADTIVGTWNGNRSEPGGIAAALDAATAAARLEEEHAAIVSARRAAALETATEEAKAAAARSNIELHDAHVRVIYETGETHESGLSAVERTTAALAAAADQQLPTETIIRTWKANKSAPGGIAAALVTKTRVSRLERLFSAPRAAEAFIVALDEQNPSSRTPTHPTNIDRALDIADRKFGREAEQQIPGASSATGRRAGDDVTEAADTDRHVQQVIDWLRTEVERQLVERTGAAARLDQRNRNSVRPVSEKIPPVRKLPRRVPDATREDAELVRALTDLENATEPGRLDQRNRNSVRPVSEKIPPVRKLPRRVPDATREDAELVRALTDLENATEPGRLDQRNRNSVRPVSEKTPPASRSARRVPDATQEDVEREQKRRQTEAAQRRRQERLSRVEQALRIASAAPAVAPPVKLPPRPEQEIRREDAAAAAAEERAKAATAAEERAKAATAAEERARAAAATLAEAERAARDATYAVATDIAARQPRGLPWPKVEEQLTDRQSADERYHERQQIEAGASLDIGLLRISLETDILEHARACPPGRLVRPVTPATVGAATSGAVDAIQDAADPLVTQILGRVRDPAPAAPTLTAPAHGAAPSRPTAPVGAGASAAEDQPRLTMVERYSQRWPKRAADTHRPDFEKLTAGASACNKLFERASPRTTADPGELPAALAKPAPAWDDETVKSVTWQATPGVGILERTESRRIVDAHLDHYEHGLPEQYAHSAEWRAIRERAEEAVRKLLDTWRYKRKDDRKKREREATAINRACGREARHLHEKMIAEREAARPDWEVTVRIRDVQQSIRKEEADRRAREQEHGVPVYRSGAPEPSRAPGPTRDRGHGR